MADQKRSLSLAFDAGQSAIALEDGEQAVSFSDMHYGVKGRSFIGGRGRPYYNESDMTNMLKRACELYDHVVLNGDIFEAVYHHFSDENTMVAACGLLVDDWVQHAQAHGATIHLVLGNHDDNSKLAQMLQAKEALYPEHFMVHPVALRLGDVLYLHGDLPLRHEQEQAEKIEEFSHVRQLDSERKMGTRFSQHLAPTPQRWAESASVCANAKLHWMVQRATDKARSHEQTAQALHDVLSGTILMEAMVTTNGEKLPPVKHVVTGHTHRPFADIQRGAGTEDDPHVHYSNTGTMLEIERFNPILATGAGQGHMNVERLTVSELQNQQLEQKTKHLIERAERFFDDSSAALAR